MMKTRTFVVAAFAGMAVTVTATSAQGQLLESATSSLSGPGGAFEVTTGFVRVPELRTPNGQPAKTIELAVVRLRRTGAATSQSAHVLLAGGPGDSGVNLAMGLVRQGGPPVWELFDGDVIGIDQRGTGRSRPNLETGVRFDLPLDRPGSIDEWLPRIDEASRKVAAEFRGRGIRLEAYNTRESAHDVADVLHALGYGRATLWGRSYGSHLALATLALHPTLVGRLVLVSPEGLDHTWKRPAHVDAVIDQLVARGAKDFKANLREVLARLRERPATVNLMNPVTGAPATIVLGEFDVQWIVAQALGDPRLVSSLPAAVREMTQGRFDGVAQVALVRRTRGGVQSAMKHMMDLSSGASPERWRQIQREAKDALLGNAINFPGMFLTGAWAPVTDLGDDFRRPPRSAVPTLILAGDLDPRTPVSNARELAASLSAATVVVLENGSHEFDVFGSAPVRDVISRFFRNERLTTTIALPPIAFQ
jgi:pimeloyl-ACP methyl ester carboxylesterase